jgi:hypothetical protein
VSKGLHWGYQGGEFTIFGLEGWINERSRWVLPMDIVGGVSHPVAPTPLSPVILEIIQNDIREGNGDKIAYVGVNPLGALQLALEGVITEKRLREAEETVDRIVLTVVLDGTERQLVVLENPTHEVATYDKHGKVV